MTINDTIVLMTLIIALIAIINEKNRAYLLLKFTKVDVLLFSMSFVLINYFVFYQDFEHKGWVIRSLYFEGFGFHHPRHYAYVITLSSLIYLFYKIYGSFYANSKLDQVNTFYNKQIENQEVSFLTDLIERYHRKDIVRWVSKGSGVSESPEPFLELYEQEKWNVHLENWFANQIASRIPVSWYNRRNYAYNVLFFIVDSPGFISYAANLRPYFFPEIYRHFTGAKRNRYPDDLINSYFKELLGNKNYWLKKELKESENFDGGQPEKFHEDNSILSGLMKDLTVAAQSKVWRAFGEAAVNELQEELLRGPNSQLYSEYFTEYQLWEFRTQFSVQFFKMLIGEAISKLHTGEHFWLYYYDRIVVLILKAWEQNPPAADLSKSIGYKFIDNIYSNLLQWLDLANAKVDTALYYDIIRCIGNVLKIVNDSGAYPQVDKTEMVDRLMTTYCNLQENDETDRLRTELENVLLRPNMLVNPGDSYYGIVAAAWVQFDKIPHRIQNFADLAYFGRLKRTVIGPLGLNTAAP